MGLDMYAYTKKVIIDNPEPQRVDLAYWRKHANLHGWMEQLWVDRGRPGAHDNDSDTFNCIELELFPDDIDALERAVNGEELPFTTGFFFGASEPEDKIDDLKFIAAARATFAAGERVFYNSWW